MTPARSAKRRDRPPAPCHEGDRAGPGRAAGERGRRFLGGPLEQTVRAWAVAATLSGAPSTAYAVATGRDPLEAVRAAGTVLPGRWRARGGLVAGLVAHAAISALWTAVLAAVLGSCGRSPGRARKPGGTAAATAVGAAAGLGIAALDLGVLARRLPTVRRLPQLPQWADHVAFGALAAAVLARGRGPSAAGRP